MLGHSSKCYVSVAQLKVQCGDHSESGCRRHTKVNKEETMWKVPRSSSLLLRVSYFLLHHRKREAFYFSKSCLGYGRQKWRGIPTRSSSIGSSVAEGSTNGSDCPSKHICRHTHMQLPDSQGYRANRVSLILLIHESPSLCYLRDLRDSHNSLNLRDLRNLRSSRNLRLVSQFHHSS